MWQLVNVNAASGNISRHQCADVAILEALQRLRAGRLAFVAMQRHGRNAGLGQVLGHIVGAKLGAGEHQHLAPVVLVDDVCQQGFFLAATHRVDGLRDALHGGVARRDLNGHGVSQQAVGQFADFVAEGGAEQQSLLLLGHQRQYFLDVVNEAHVQHAVGFIKHQNLHLAQVQRTLACMVQQAAGCGDQNVNATAKLFDLRAHADTAEHHHRGEVEVFAIGANAFLDLRGQFARRRHDEGANRVDAAPVGQAGLA